MTSLDDLDVDALDFGGISPQEFARLVKDTPAPRWPPSW